MITRTVVRSGGGGGSGASFPSSVKYFSGVAVNKVGLNAAITGPTSFGIRGTVPSDTDYPVAIVGGLSLTAADTLSFTDGTNTATLKGTFTAGDDVVIAIEFNEIADKMRMRRIA